jgi:hypothetical protein
MKTRDKSLSSAPGFIVARKMTTNDDSFPLFSDKFSSKSTGCGEKGGQK